MLNHKFAVSFIMLLLGGAAAGWLWNDFNSSLEQQAIVLPQRTIVPHSYKDAAETGADSAWIKSQYENLEKQVAEVWGASEVILPSPTRFVKYTQNYKARSIVDFETGEVVIESVSSVYPQRSLKDVIVGMVLAPASPSVDMFSAKDIILSDNPALYGQLLNKKGQAMRYSNRAMDYANELLANGIEERRTIINGRPVTIYRVHATLASDSVKKRAGKYETAVSRAAARYGLGERLIYSIVHTESSFNPFAVSPASAYGLMQVVPSSAGAEVYEFLHGKRGRPSREFLFDASNNIEYGAAYLHLLANRHFADVKDTGARELCVIAAYNGGPGAVQRTFGGSRQAALNRINSMTRQQVYRHLVKNLPSNETRRYVDKVLAALNSFSAGG